MGRISSALLVLGFLTLLAVGVPLDQDAQDSEESAREFMLKLNVELNERQNLVTEASWKYASNITDFNLKQRNEMSAEHAKFLKVSLTGIP